MMSNQKTQAAAAIRSVLPYADDEWVSALATLVVIDYNDIVEQEGTKETLDLFAAYYADRVSNLCVEVPF